MPRYGDFDALKEAVYNSKIRLPHDLMAIVKLIDNAPAADVEPVVHCKDCEYWTKQVDSLQGRCALGGHYPTGGWYCANGERRNDA